MSASLLELLSVSYYASDPSYVLALTGAFIKDIKIVKSGFKLMFQNATLIDLTPSNYEFKLHAMTKEKLEFVLPGVFTIGINILTAESTRNKLKPDVGLCDSLESTEVLIHSKMSPKEIEEFNMNNIKKYTRLLAKQQNNKNSIITGIIEGETRALAAALSMEDLFNNRQVFKNNVIRAIDIELERFGLKVFNANIKELQDSNGSDYFSTIRKKIISDTVNQAKIDVANAELRGEVESAQKDKDKEVKVAAYNAEKNRLKNDLQEEIVKSNSKLAVMKYEQELIVKNAENISNYEAQKRLLELEKINNKIRVDNEIEKIRSEKMAQAVVDNEIIIRDAEARYAASIKTADANLYRIQKEAEAALYLKEKEIEGIKNMYDNEADGIKKLLAAFNNDNNALMSYLMMRNNQIVDIAKINSESVRDLKPNITVWNTGNTSEDVFSPIRNVMQTIPPMFDTIQKQTGIKILPNLVDVPAKN
ncbi:hypothetical protein Catovirus_1_211 [Catovirus CTV1]|uniref:Band 7 domain-containing protein n=1 Tax=Catovirus CTV1 TaxID=1977631 RepID=A0A1V0S8Y6_9VIRU|nr:hypothetical protein Catovirus_1_211 [Catovirus CTV1]